MLRIFIPCYNEIENLPHTVKELQNILNKGNIPYQLHLYDNNSIDGTRAYIHNLAMKDIHIIPGFCGSKGKGNVYKRFREDMLKEASEDDIFMMIDGDYTYHPLRLNQTIENFQKENIPFNPIVYTGRRLGYEQQNKSFIHGFGNKLICKLFKFVYKTHIDIFSGFRIFDFTFLKEFIPKGKDFELETEMTVFAIRNGYIMKELSCLYTDRTGGKSKVNGIRDGIKIIWAFMNEVLKDYPAYVLIPPIFIIFLILRMLKRGK